MAVAGAQGKMGAVAVRAFESSPEFDYAGGLARAEDAASDVHASLDELFERGRPDVLLDFTTHPDSVGISMKAASSGVRPVVGVSGWNGDESEALGTMARDRGIGAMIVPNFSLGAVLMLRFAEEAARHFSAAQIVEMHRVEKKDKPSGTALETAARIERVAGIRPDIASVRLPGLIAHQEVLFAGSGDLLTVRHDTLSRESFVPGMFAAVRAVMHVRGLATGLDAILDEVRVPPSTSQ